jgi:hypothetical protein
MDALLAASSTPNQVRVRSRRSGQFASSSSTASGKTATMQSSDPSSSCRLLGAGNGPALRLSRLAAHTGFLPRLLRGGFRPGLAGHRPAFGTIHWPVPRVVTSSTSIEPSARRR